MEPGSQRPVARGILLGIAICLVNAGCAGTIEDLFDGNVRNRQDIEPNDEDGLFPGVRLNRDLLPDRHPPRQGLFEGPDPTPIDPPPGRKPIDSTAWDSPTRPPGVRKANWAQPIFSAEVEYSVGVGGNDADTIRGGGDYVDYDGTRFFGPQKVQYSYDLHVGTLGVTAGGRFFEKLSLEGLAGLSTSALHLELDGPTQSASDTGVALGAHLGARGTWTIHPVFEIYGEGRLHLLGGLQDSRRTVLLLTSVVAGNLHLTSNLSAFGGWRWWRYQEDVHSASDMNDIVLTGPTFGILLRF